MKTAKEYLNEYISIAKRLNTLEGVNSLDYHINLIQRKRELYNLLNLSEDKDLLHFTKIAIKA